MSDEPISDYLARKFAGRCAYPGCPADAADGANYCSPHLLRARARDLAYRTKKRGDLRRKKRCIDCGRKSKRQRCPACFRKSRGVDKRERGVDKSGRGRIVHEDRSKYGWAPTAHYVGRDRRGAPSLADRAKDLTISIGNALKKLAKLGTNHAHLLEVGAYQLGRGQREQYLHAAADPGQEALGLLIEVLMVMDPTTTRARLESVLVPLDDDK